MKTLLIYSSGKGTVVLIKWLNSNTIPPKIAQILTRKTVFFHRQEGSVH